MVTLISQRYVPHKIADIFVLPSQHHQSSRLFIHKALTLLAGEESIPQIPWNVDAVAFLAPNLEDFRSLSSEIECECKIRTRAILGEIAPNDVTIRGVDVKLAMKNECLCPTRFGSLDSWERREEIERLFSLWNCSPVYGRRNLRNILLLRRGDRVFGPELKFLQLLKMTPFVRQVRVVGAFVDGSFVPGNVTTMSEVELKTLFVRGCRNVAAASLELGLLNECSLHSVLQLSVASLSSFSQGLSDSCQEQQADKTSKRRRRRRLPRKVTFSKMSDYMYKTTGLHSNPNRAVQPQELAPHPHFHGQSDIYTIWESAKGEGDLAYVEARRPMVCVSSGDASHFSCLDFVTLREVRRCREDSLLDRRYSSLCNVANHDHIVATCIGQFRRDFRTPYVLAFDPYMDEKFGSWRELYNKGCYEGYHRSRCPITSFGVSNGSSRIVVGMCQKALMIYDPEIDPEGPESPSPTAITWRSRPKALSGLTGVGIFASSSYRLALMDLDRPDQILMEYFVDPNFGCASAMFAESRHSESAVVCSVYSKGSLLVHDSGSSLPVASMRLSRSGHSVFSMLDEGFTILVGVWGGVIEVWDLRNPSIRQDLFRPHRARTRILLDTAYSEPSTPMGVGAVGSICRTGEDSFVSCCMDSSVVSWKRSGRVLARTEMNLPPESCVFVDPTGSLKMLRSARSEQLSLVFEFLAREMIHTGRIWVHLDGNRILAWKSFL